jgi:hypothetical protein
MKRMILKPLSEATRLVGLVLDSHIQTDTATFRRAATRLQHRCALGARQANRMDLLQVLLRSLVPNRHACHQARSRTSLSFH